MSNDARALIEKFNWQPQPKAQAVINQLASECRAKCPGAEKLAQRMKDETGTRFVDWIDHIAAPKSPALEQQLAAAGFEKKPQPGASDCWICDKGMFPPVVLHATPVVRVGIKVEFVNDFLFAQNLPLHDKVQGEPLSRFRHVTVFTGNGAELAAVERHGWVGFAPDTSDASTRVKARGHLEALRTRNRFASSDAEGFAITNRIVDASIKDLGRDWTCDLFFAAERDYWMSRNRAAKVQKARQDKLGLGWANHDHHTYRCTRGNFKGLIQLWEKLGFFARERFYAGAEAGWGAQVMEQAVTGITTFNDVDMSPEELLGDFSHDGLPEHQDKLGTVGLWCALHGEAVLQAGMHHLEAQFDWHALVQQLERDGGIKTMAPFTTFPYLRQAFTEGERWSIDHARVDALLGRKLITADQAAQFKAHGAIGSHLENLERNDGFKGFNQQGVSDIIARTDPRRLTAQLASN